MTDRLELRAGSAVLTEEAFGGIDTAEMEINPDEFEEYELDVDIEGTTLISEFITVLESGGYELDLSSFATSNVDVRKADTETEDNRTIELGRTPDRTTREQMPPVPDDDGLETPTDRTHYNRLVENPDSQPAEYRRFVRSEGEIARRKFDRWAKQQGYEPEDSGSHESSLIMLERIGEIERRGRSDNQIFIWLGE